MQFWQYSISLQFLQIITANDFAFGSLQNLQLLTSANCSASLHAIFHCNSKFIAVIPLQFHCNFPVIVCSHDRNLYTNCKFLQVVKSLRCPGGLEIQTSLQTIAGKLQWNCSGITVMHFELQ